MITELASHPLAALVGSQCFGALLMFVAFIVLFPRHRHAIVDPVVAWWTRTFTDPVDPFVPEPPTIASDDRARRAREEAIFTAICRQTPDPAHAAAIAARHAEFCEILEQEVLRAMPLTSTARH